MLRKTPIPTEAKQNQVEDFNNKLKESEVIVENAVEEKEAMESKLIVIQELWEKQKIRQETF